jgi:hypothetical protein
VFRYVLRATAPTVPAVLGILAIRTAMTGERTLDLALAELALYCAITIALTLVLERSLIREAFGYLRRSPKRALAVGA